MNDAKRKFWQTMLTTALLVTALVAVALHCGGCVYKGAKVTEGTDLAIGLNVPVSEGTLQFQVLNYLSGFRLGVDRNAVLKCKYTAAETNDYLGVVHTRVYKTVDASVEPCETEAAPAAEEPPPDSAR